MKQKNIQLIFLYFYNMSYRQICFHSEILEHTRNRYRALCWSTKRWKFFTNLGAEPIFCTQLSTSPQVLCNNLIYRHLLLRRVGQTLRIRNLLIISCYREPCGEVESCTQKLEWRSGRRDRA